MKVLYFVNAFNRGGAEMGLLRLVDGGLFAGCDLRVATIVRGSGEAVEDLAARRIDTTVFTDRRSMRPVDLVRAGWGLARMIRRWRPDVLVLSLPQANILGRIVGGALRVPTIVSFEHNTRLAKPIYERLFRLLSPIVDVTFADCEETLQTVLRHFYRRAPRACHVVPLVSFPKDEWPSPLPDPNGPRLVSVGRLTRPKNHEAAIEAVALLRRRGRTVRLDIVGEGERRDALAASARGLGVDDLVAFPGFVAAWWQRTRYDAFLLTSLHEGLCIVALEAMWAGIPVVAPAVGGLRDYGNADNMLVLPEATGEQAADALERLLADPSLAARLGANARAMVAARYGRKAVEGRYAELNRLLRDGFAG